MSYHGSAPMLVYGKVAPSLAIGENELERALDIMDALPGELDFT
jgi:hypothetical protein